MSEQTLKADQPPAFAADATKTLSPVNSISDSVLPAVLLVGVTIAAVCAMFWTRARIIELSHPPGPIHFWSHVSDLGDRASGRSLHDHHTAGKCFHRCAHHRVAPQVRNALDARPHGCDLSPQ